jgi:hypothetical protein
MHAHVERVSSAIIMCGSAIGCIMLYHARAAASRKAMHYSKARNLGMQLQFSLRSLSV